MAQFVKGQSGNPDGRPEGAPNKATTQAREAIAKFVDDGSESFKTWLSMVANGVRETEKLPDGIVRETDKFRMVTDVLEYHLPKLGRMEHVGDKDAPIEHRVTSATDQAILDRFLKQNAGGQTK